MAAKRPDITIALADWQVHELQPLFDRVARQNDRGGPPPMLVAQVFPDGMRVGYFSPERAAKLQRAVNGRVSKTQRSGAFSRSTPLRKQKRPPK